MTFSEIIETFDEVLARRIDETKLRASSDNDKDALKSIQSLFFFIKFDLNFYALASEVQLEEIWTYVREDRFKLDFVLGLRNELFIRLESGMRELMVTLKNTHSPSSKENYLKSVMDNETVDRLPGNAFMENALKNDDWLIVIFLIHLCTIPVGLLK